MVLSRTKHFLVKFVIGGHLVLGSFTERASRKPTNVARAGGWSHSGLQQYSAPQKQWPLWCAPYEIFEDENYPLEQTHYPNRVEPIIGGSRWQFQSSFDKAIQFFFFYFLLSQMSCIFLITIFTWKDTFNMWNKVKIRWKAEKKNIKKEVLNGKSLATCRVLKLSGTAKPAIKV